MFFVNYGHGISFDMLEETREFILSLQILIYVIFSIDALLDKEARMKNCIVLCSCVIAAYSVIREHDLIYNVISVLQLCFIAWIFIQELRKRSA